MNLQYSHKITEKRNFGKVTVNQEMILRVDYDPEEDSISDPEVFVYQDGKMIAEISKLLDKAEGSPLSEMLEAIDWYDVYKTEVQPVEND